MPCNWLPELEVVIARLSPMEWRVGTTIAIEIARDQIVRRTVDTGRADETPNLGKRDVLCQVRETDRGVIPPTVSVHRIHVCASLHYLLGLHIVAGLLTPLTRTNST